MKSFKKRKLIIILSTLSVIFFLIRVWHINSDLLFHSDQGLHSMAIWNIWHEKRLSLLGHPSDVDGLIHAPIYYWLMTPAYALSKGNPASASIFQILLETLSLPFLFFALKKLFDEKVAIFTLILYTFSYGFVSLSRWLVNVNPILPFSNLFLYLLARQLNGKSSFKLSLSTSLVVGVIIQLNAAVGVFLIPFLIWFFRKQKRLKIILEITLGILIPASPIFIFQLKHNFVLVSALVRFIKTSQSGVGISSKFFENIYIFFGEITKISTFPFSLVATLAFIVGLVQLGKNKYRNTIYALFIIPFISLGIFKGEQ